MKIPHLLACFAVAATAAAADLKDSTEVARAWDDSTTSKPLVDDFSLRGTIPPPPRAFPPTSPVLHDKPMNLFQVPSWGTPGQDKPARPEPGIDSPRYRPPEVLPNNVPMPRGAKPWLYGGQTYWLMPLIPSREK
jgi:hypothetical protein